jgi:capsular exopolysaccharide synthesis family protein
MLLERHAEAKIQKASNSSDIEIVDFARIKPDPIWPISKIIYIVGLMISYGLTSIVLILRKELNMKIRTDEDIKRINLLPIAGHIPHTKEKVQSVVLENPKAEISEAFRSLRTRLQFFTKNINSPVILVTSSIPKEGKSFVAANLASIYSFTSSKTVLIGGDLRRPNVFLQASKNCKKGLSTWLIDMHELEEITLSTENRNLWVIPAGPVPPNPAELLTHEKLLKLISLLKKKFDYIIIDSAPIGIISDTYALARVVDATLLVVRSNKTTKKILRNTLEETKVTGLNHICLLMNDIRNGSGYYGYDRAYGSYSRNKNLITN